MTTNFVVYSGKYIQSREGSHAMRSVIECSNAFGCDVSYSMPLFVGVAIFKVSWRPFEMPLAIGNAAGMCKSTE